jgi:hypothetical protein
LHKLAHPGTAYGTASSVTLAVGLAIAGIHVAGEQRKSSIVRLSKPAKLASMVPRIVGLFMVVG